MPKLMCISYIKSSLAMRKVEKQLCKFRYFKNHQQSIEELKMGKTLSIYLYLFVYLFL